MAGAYNRGKFNLANGTLSLSSDDVRVLLVTAGYTFNPDHHVVSDLSPGSNELSGGVGYVRKVLTSKSVVEDDVNDRAVFTADNVTWTSINTGLGSIPVAAVVFKQVTNDSDSFLIAYYDFPATVTNGGDFTIQWNVGGIIRLS